MESIKSPTMTGLNEIVQTIRGAQQQYPEQQHSVTWVTFNGLGTKTIECNQSVDALTDLNIERYQPQANTPLFDAMGKSLLHLQQFTERLTDYTVLVSILTDGDENASQIFTAQGIQALIRQLKDKNWSFTYMGANHNVNAVAKSLSIDTSITFQAQEDDLKQLFERDRKGRMAFYDKRSKGQSTHQSQESYFDQP